MSSHHADSEKSVQPDKKKTQKESEARTRCASFVLLRLMPSTPQGGLAINLRVPQSEILSLRQVYSLIWASEGSNSTDFETPRHGAAVRRYAHVHRDLHRHEHQGRGRLRATVYMSVFEALSERRRACAPRQHGIDRAETLGFDPKPLALCRWRGRARSACHVRPSTQPSATRLGPRSPRGEVERNRGSRSPRRRVISIPPQAARFKRANDRYRGRNASHKNGGVEGSNSTE